MHRQAISLRNDKSSEKQYHLNNNINNKLKQLFQVSISSEKFALRVLISRISNYKST